MSVKRKIVKRKRKAAPVRRARTPMLPRGTYTAHQVLTFVAEQVAKEPKRLAMATWVTMLQGRVLSDVLTAKQKPECGTVACFGGWINIAMRNFSPLGPQYSDGFLALKKLGLDGAPYFSAAAQAAEDLRQLFHMWQIDRAPALKEFNRIIKAHEAVLKSLEVTVD